MNGRLAWTLVEFLLARISEDEVAARETQGRPLDPYAFFPDGCWTESRVLVECFAKRKIVERHASCGSGVGYCDDGGHGWDHVPGGGCGELGDLAWVYGDHADYREEWRNA